MEAEDSVAAHENVVEALVAANVAALVGNLHAGRRSVRVSGSGHSHYRERQHGGEKRGNESPVD